MNDVYDHYDVSSYPKTSSTGVAYFIHFLSPLIQEGDTKLEVQKAINRQMLKVC